MKQIIAGILVAVALVIGAVLLLGGKAKNVQPAAVAAGNVTVAGDQQIVEIKVAGGYQPTVSAVKAGVPTVLRFETNGTYDCSASIRIPSLGISRFLPSTGTTDINIGTLAPGTLHGMCSMGMFRFDINAQ